MLEKSEKIYVKFSGFTIRSTEGGHFYVFWKTTSTFAKEFNFLFLSSVHDKSKSEKIFLFHIRKEGVTFITL